MIHEGRYRIRCRILTAGEDAMSEKELYRQKMKARLDELMADIDKLKAKASGASADMKLKLNEHIKDIEEKIDEGKAKLAELGNTNEERWESVKERVDSVWEALKHAVKDVSAKFKE
jgi:peptidoglycan hydrolase CwlO-like protein